MRKECITSFSSQIDYWTSIERQLCSRQRVNEGSVSTNKSTFRDAKFEIATFSISQSGKKLHEICLDFKITEECLILWSVATAMLKVKSSEQLDICFERHGRELGHLDLSRTTGWLTSRFPFVVDALTNEKDILEQIHYLQHKLKKVPLRGASYGFLRSMNMLTTPKCEQSPNMFVFLGTVDKRSSNSSSDKSESEIFLHYTIISVALRKMSNLMKLMFEII